MKIIAFCFMLLFANISNAGMTVGIPTGVGSWVTPDGKELFAVYFNPNDLDKVDCNKKSRYVVTTENKAYKTIVSVILTHYAAQKPLRVAGSGQCEIYHNSETLLWTLSGGQPF